MAQQHTKPTVSHDLMTISHRFRGVDYVRLSEEETAEFQDQDDKTKLIQDSLPQRIRLHDPRERRNDCDGKTVYYGLKRGWRTLKTPSAHRRAGRAHKPRRYEIVDGALVDDMIPT